MDMFLSLGFFAMFFLFGTLDFDTIFSIAPYMNTTSITIISLLLLVGAMAKSSQIFLHNWLPGSMEGKFYNFNFLILIKPFNTLYFKKIFINFLLFLIDLKFASAIKSYSSKARDSKGRFVSASPDTQPVGEPLPTELKEALIGDLLGDGHLWFTHKDKTGNPKGNALYAMTLKDYNYIYYLWSKVYAPICTKIPIRAWPKHETGKTPSQYSFSTKSLPSLKEIHKEWYVLNPETKIFVKFVPLNIRDILTAKGKAHWLVGDAYWNSLDNTIWICTDNFTLQEVELLINTLNSNFGFGFGFGFGLEASLRRRVRPNKVVCLRIRFNSKVNNITKLRI